MKRWLKKIALGLGVLFVLIQLWPAGRANPPVTSDLSAPPEVKDVLRRSCYDCHSNESRWPWYAYVAPVSWFVVGDVNEAREKVNFSRWGEYTDKKRMRAAQEIVDELDQGSMPLPSYLWMHPSAKVSAEEIETIRRWSEVAR